MTFKHIVLIVLCVKYIKSTPQGFVFVDDLRPQNVYYPTVNVVRPIITTTPATYKDNDGIVFETQPPTYQVVNRPSPPQITRPPLTTQPPPPPQQPIYNYQPQTPANTFRPDQQIAIKPATTSAISQGIYNMGQEILYRALANLGDANVKYEVISPLSISGVGYLLYLGSAGETSSELAKMLGLNDGTNQKEIHEQFGLLLDQIVNDREIRNEDKLYPEDTQNRVHHISVANALFLNSNFPLRRQYENVARNTYKSEVRQINFATDGFAAKRYIDNWVSNKTHGKIPTILSEPPTGSTQMIVVSALYFKALWWEQLEVSHVAPFSFYPNGINRPPIMVETVMFTSQTLPHYQSNELNCRIIGLKYQKQISTMYIVQPLDSNRETLRALQTQLTAEKLNFLISRMVPIFVSALTIPKFHLQSEIDLKPIFQQMGVRSLFTNANLTPIIPTRNDYPDQQGSTNDLEYLDAVRRSSQYGSSVSISKIYHKVDLVVDEKGTEGGAATAAAVDKIFGNTIKINTPFMFVVRQDDTRLPLFYGVMFEPVQ